MSTQAVKDEMAAIGWGFDSLPSLSQLEARGYRRISGLEPCGPKLPVPGLPVPGPVTGVRVCEGVVYATVGKSVYALKSGEWVLAFKL